MIGKRRVGRVTIYWREAEVVMGGLAYGNEIE